MIKIKIVLTGGPGAGKTTILNILKEYLDANNIPNAVIGETVTELNQKYGIKIQLRESGNVLDFQDLVYLYQKNKEDAVNIGRGFDNEEYVVICDRGIPDNRAYLHNHEFNAIARRHEENLLSLSNNYDYCIALSSAATLENGYTLENNATRHENKAEAEALNKRTLDCWALAKNMVIMPATNNFEEKITRTVQIFQDMLQKKYHNESYKFDVTGMDTDYLIGNNETYNLIVNEYILKDEKNHKSYLEKIVHNDDAIYFYVEKKIDMYEETEINCRRLTAKRFNTLINNFPIEKTIVRTEKRFIKDNNIYKIKKYKNIDVLEIVSDGLNRAYIPDNLKQIDNFELESAINDKNLSLIRKK